MMTDFEKNFLLLKMGKSLVGGEFGWYFQILFEASSLSVFVNEKPTIF
jgi:hypothetical protein